MGVGRAKPRSRIPLSRSAWRPRVAKGTVKSYCRSPFSVLAARFMFRFMSNDALSSMSHRVHDRVDPDGVSLRREQIEIPRVLTLALPGIRDVGVVRHQHHDVAVTIGDGAQMRLGAVVAAL